MASFTEVYKQELKNKGVISSLGSSVLKTTKERLDPRNVLFGGKGIVAATGQKIFGKGYSAITKKPVIEKQKSVSNDLIVEQLANQNMRLSIFGKNTMPLRAMSRDINVMRQNMVKLVKLNAGDTGTKAATKADMFFRKQSEEEKAYENMLGEKKSPQVIKTESAVKESNKGSTFSVFSKIILPIAVVFGGLALAVSQGIDSIKNSFDNIKTSISNVVNSILSSIGITPKADEIIKPINRPIEEIVSELESIKFDDEGNIISGLKPSEAPGPDEPATTAPSPAPAPQTGSHETSPTRVPPTQPSASGSVFSTIRQAISGVEAGGNYDSTFNSFLAKNGIINTRNMSGVMTPEAWSQSTLGKKKSLTEMTLAEVHSFQTYRDSVSPGTGAVGRYAFMPTTLFGAIHKGKQVPGLVQKLGLPLDAKFDKETQDKLQDLLTRGNMAILKSNNVPLTPENIYMAHAIGPGGAVSVFNAIKRGQGDKLLADVLAEGSGSKNPEQYKSNLLKHNPQLVGVKASDYAPRLAQSLVQKGGLPQTMVGKSIEETPPTTVASAGSTPAAAESRTQVVTPEKPPVGAVVSQASTENSVLRAQTGGNLNVVNVSNVTRPAQTASLNLKQEQDPVPSLVNRMVT